MRSSLAARGVHRFMAVGLVAGSLALVGVGADARADDAQNQTLAAQLFRAGREDMAAEKWAEAAPKFQEAHRLAPAMGTLLNLAICQEHIGKTASAYANFQAIVGEAKASGRTDRLEVAQTEIDKLKPQLADLTLHVDADVQRLKGLDVSVDGAPIATALFNTKVNYDPGHHVLTAEADGRKPFTQSFDVTPASHSDVTVPMLAVKPIDPNDIKVSKAEAERDSRKRALRTAGWVLVGVGGASVATSLGFGLAGIVEKGKIKDVDACKAGNCSQSDSDASKTANTWATVANVTFGAGLGLAAVGTVLVLIGRADKPSSDAHPPTTALRLVPSFGPGGGGLSMAGAW